MILETLFTCNLVTIFLMFLELENEGANPLLVELEVKKVLRRPRLCNLGTLPCVRWYRRGRDIVMVLCLL